MRGKLGFWGGWCASVGITPAGAGKTKSSGTGLYTNRDHPRRCGENPLLVCLLQALIGSPPQVRGKQQGAVQSPAAARITPAGAGKTSPQYRFSASNPDHPRRCGENVSSRSASLKCLGSPPQVRGKRILNNACGMDDGITPAGAGKTVGQV